MKPFLRRGLIGAVAFAVLLACAAGPASAAKKRSPNLVVKALTATPAELAPGGTLSARYKVKNAGNWKARRSTLGFLLSEDRTPGGDVTLGEVRVGRLAAGTRDRGTADLTVPPTATGTLFLIGCADVDAEVQESRERNCRATSSPITIIEEGPVPPPPPATYSIGGSVSGLSGTLQLQNNDADTTSISGNGAFMFPTEIEAGQTYAVKVSTQPAGQTCNVTNGSGTVGSSSVTDVAVSCQTNTYTVGGSVSGLSGTLELQNNGADTTSISSDGSFTFSTPVATGQNYSVTVLSQPAGQTCTVTNGSGTVGGANITDVAITCSFNTYTVGGTVSNLSGPGLILRNNGVDNLSIPPGATSFTFPTPLVDGSIYNVTVLQQPVAQTCVVINGSGVIGGSDVTNVAVECS